MPHVQKLWIVTADERAARLLRVRRTPTGAIHVDMDDEISDNWVDHEHGRPSALHERPMPPGQYGGHALAPQGHEDETRRARFARQVAVWLERQADDLHIGRIDVFAPPRFLGALRDAWSPRLALRVHEHHEDLSNLVASDVAHHPAVTALVDGSGNEE